MRVGQLILEVSISWTASAINIITILGFSQNSIMESMAKLVITWIEETPIELLLQSIDGVVSTDGEHW